MKRKFALGPALLWAAACLLALLGLAAAAAAPPAAAAGRKDPLRFAWLSDTHVGSDRGADDLRASVADINGQKGLAFVLLTGDITEIGSFDNLSLAKQILDGLKIPYHVIPGNHDTKWSESGGSDVARLWGEDRFVFEAGGLRFIGLSQGPILHMADGHFAPQDVRWLDGLLAEPDAALQPTVFVSHYPLDPSIDNWYVVLDKLKKVPTVAVLCGHGHKDQALDFEGLRGVMGRANYGDKERAPGYNIVEIGAKAMSFAERTGGRTLAAWCRIDLEKNGFPVVASGTPAVRGGGGAAKQGIPPRPDFSVNGQYPAVKERWRFESGWTIASSAAPAGDTVVFTDGSGAVRALRVADGSIAWEFKTDEPIYSTPEVAGGRVVFGSTDTRIYALDARLGTPVWKLVTRSPVVACPRIVDGIAYIGAGDHIFRAIEMATGRLAWRAEGIDGYVETKPLVTGGVVVFGAWDGRLHALDAKTGWPLWDWMGDKPSVFYSPAACRPVAANGRVFIVSPEPWLAAIELESGRGLWGTDNWAVRESIGISEDGKRIYVRTTDGLIAAISSSADDADPVWETDGGFGRDIGSGQLVEKDGVVFYGTMNGLLLALDGATGAIRWKHRVGVTYVNTVTPLSGKDVVITDFDGRVILVSSDK
jgi:outer membrane protein assembly factor BamB/predicted MPP superfamily phosphohydrolase